MTNAELRKAIRNKLTTMPTNDVNKLIELVNTLAPADQDETHHLQTLHHYLTTNNWQHDYNTLISSRKTEQSQ
jgi:hypothetical protein